MMEERQWYVLRTQLKREKLAAANLRRLEGVEVFLPRLRYVKTTRRGRVWWVEPLFPGYLLAKFSVEEMGTAVTYAGGVSRVVRFGDEVPAVAEEFVESLKRELREAVGDGEELVVGRKVEVGEEVEIATGPLQGMSGQVLEVRPGKERVKLLLEFMGQAQPLEMSLYDLILAKYEVPEGWKHDEGRE